MSNSKLAYFVITCGLVALAPACGGAGELGEPQESESPEPETQQVESALSSTRLHGSGCSTTVRLSGGNDEVILDFEGGTIAVSPCDKYLVRVSVETSKYHYQAITTQVGGDLPGDRSSPKVICEGKSLERRLSRYEFGNLALLSARVDRGNYEPAVGLPGTGSNFQPEGCNNPTISLESILVSSQDYLVDARAREYNGSPAKVLIRFRRILN